MTGYDVHTDKAIKELRARLDQAERERDEARAALAAAEMARDVAWVRAVRDAGGVSACIYRDALGLTFESAYRFVGVAGSDIATAIRAARGAL